MNGQKPHQVADNRPQAVSICCLLVFTVIHYFEGYYWQVVAGLACTLVIAVLAWRQHKKPTYEDSRLLRLVAWNSLLAMLLLTIWRNSMGSTFFIFPLVMSAFIIFPKGMALKLGLMAAVLASAISTQWLDSSNWFRYLFSQVMSIVIGYIYASIVEKNQNKLAKLANTDPLTKVYNRHELYHRIHQTLANSFRYNTPCCLIMIDIDFFKAINDEHGHLIGDQILFEFCQVLKQRIRSGDHLFRYGGEEFAIILPSENLRQGLAVAEGLRHTIADHNFSHDIKLTISQGVAECQEGDTEKHLLERADEALYSAKQARNTVVPAKSVVCA